MPDKTLVLASSSPARKCLLERLKLPFLVEEPNIDEAPAPEENAQALVERLALSKAKAVGQRCKNALIIGSDQLAVCKKSILGKPLNYEAAFGALSQISGQTVIFYTALCVLDSTTGNYQLKTEPYTVVFRDLNPDIIARYLTKEEPYHCAGSFKSEGLGIALVKQFSGEDPTALIGLPLIRLTELLQAAGVELP